MNTQQKGGMTTMMSKLDERLAAQEEEALLEITQAGGYAEREYAELVRHHERFVGHVNAMRQAARDLLALRNRRHLVAVKGGRAMESNEPPRAA